MTDILPTPALVHSDTDDRLTLTLGHLYPEQLNMYGDRGNIITLTQRCAWRGVQLRVIPMDIGAPLDANDAKALINRTKAGVKLKGYRGKPKLHEPSVIKALVGLSNLMADANGRIASIDVNPFLINEKSGVAVDALVVLNNAAAKKSAAGH